MDSPRAPQHLLSPNSLIRYKTFEGTHSCQGIQSWYSRRDQPKSVFDNNARSVWARIRPCKVSAAPTSSPAVSERSAPRSVAPVKTASEMFYADAVLEAGARLPLPDNHEDRGVYVVEGAVSIAGQTYESGQMMVFRPGDAISLTAGARGARVMLLGGETLEGPRYIWWNFVASSKERIEAAKEAWQRYYFKGEIPEALGNAPETHSNKRRLKTPRLG